MLDVVTFGETMVMMNAQESGSLKYVNQFIKQVGGAESNVAIGLSRMGIKVGWFSRLGNDSLGDYLEFFIRGEGVDVSRVKRDHDFPTGLFIKERHALKASQVYYYRHNSAASHMTCADLDAAYISQARYLHLTGITPALSSSCREMLYKAIQIARDNDVQITFDPNLRLKLWPREEMRRVVLDIISQVDIVLPGEGEGRLLLGLEDPEDMADEFLKMGPKLVVIKIGEKGAIAANSKEKIHVPGFNLDKIVDPIGAGDGFAAGFLAGRLKGYDLTEALKLANAAGAFAMTAKGDVESLPTWHDLQVFLGQKQAIER